MSTTREQSDFAHAKSFVLCSFQPTKSGVHNVNSAVHAAAEKCLSGVGQPLSSVSGRKRYNTLDFASKIVCQQGCFSPLLETQSQGMRLACRLGQCFKMLLILRSPPETRTPLDTPYIFLENGTQTVKMQFDTFPQKIQKEAATPVVCSIKLPFDVENLLPKNGVSNFCTKVRCADFIALL
ncbi:MAG: hypothetical protein J6S14_14945 [Clostridia bacterium]|nr:hypothetical protein [Clostridia bacterium]